MSKLEQHTDSGSPGMACSASSDTPETDSQLGSLANAPDDTCAWLEIGLPRRLERERDAAVRIIEQIEERYIDGCDTYEDWKFMGTTARNFLYPENDKIQP